MADCPPQDCTLHGDVIARRVAAWRDALFERLDGNGNGALTPSSLSALSTKLQLAFSLFLAQYS